MIGSKCDHLSDVINFKLMKLRLKDLITKSSFDYTYHHDNGTSHTFLLLGQTIGSAAAAEVSIESVDINKIDTNNKQINK